LEVKAIKGNFFIHSLFLLDLMVTLFDTFALYVPNLLVVIVEVVLVFGTYSPLRSQPSSSDCEIGIGMGLSNGSDSDIGGDRGFLFDK